MKKYFILIVFLIFTSHFFAQSYKFNLLTKYASENGFYEEKTVFSNANDDSYFMVIREMNKIKTAILDDLKNSKQHIFKVIENNKTSGEPQFEFIYDRTFQKIKYHKRDSYSIDVVKRDSLTKTAKITNYSNPRKKKITGSAEIIMKNSPYKLFSLFRYSALHPFEFDKDFKFNETGLVEKYKAMHQEEQIYIYLSFLLELKEFEVQAAP